MGLKGYFWRYAGVGAVGVLWVSTVVGMRLAGLSLFDWRPLSYLGVNPRSAPYFSIGLIVAAVLLIAFCLRLSSSYKLPRSFKAVFITGQVAQIISALVPYGGMARFVHTFMAFLLACTLPVLIWLFARSQTGKLRPLANKLFWLEAGCFVIGIGTFVIIGRAAPIAQALPAVAFHVWLLTVSFYKPSTEL